MLYADYGAEASFGAPGISDRRSQKPGPGDEAASRMTSGSGHQQRSCSSYCVGFEIWEPLEDTWAVECEARGNISHVQRKMKGLIIVRGLLLFL